MKRYQPHWSLGKCKSKPQLDKTSHCWTVFNQNHTNLLRQKEDEPLPGSGEPGGNGNEGVGVTAQGHRFPLRMMKMF